MTLNPQTPPADTHKMFPLLQSTLCLLATPMSTADPHNKGPTPKEGTPTHMFNFT